MAEGPLYVNLKHKEQPGKQTKAHNYKNVSILPSVESEGYQSVHERGLDPNGEYTDLTRNVNPEKTDEATLQREKMINDLLFPPQKSAPKRFNYTDIQLLPASNEEEGVPSADLSGLSPAHTQDVRNSRKPKTKPKPKKESHTEVEENISVGFDEEEEAAPYEVARVDVEEGDNSRRCSWNTHGSKIVYTVLLVVCLCVSLVAVAVAIAAIVTLSSVCEQTYLQEECEISVGGRSSIMDYNCTTPSIEVTRVSGRVIGAQFSKVGLITN